MNYIDAHCHILSDAQMQNAVAHGVGQFIVNATRPSDWNMVVDMAKHSNVFGAIGVHPWFVSELRDGWDDELVNMLNANQGLMVGEIGLDRNYPDMKMQESVFRRQLQIAHDLSRVAHIHCVGAWGKCMDIMRTCNLPPAMVFHGFSGAPELIRELVNYRAYFSFGNAVHDVRRSRMRASVAAVPESRMLVESDDDAPDTIPDTVAEIARIRGADCEQFAKIIYNNTKGVLDGKSI